MSVETISPPEPSILASTPVESTGRARQTSQSKHLSSVDGLRGFACLMVLYYHSWSHFGSHVWSSWTVGRFHISPWHFFSYGYGGVDIFFVLSGFCLAYPVLSKAGQPTDWKRYFVNRMRRILPPYWAALLLFGAMSLAIIHWHIEPFISAQTIPWPGWKQLGYAVTLISTAFNSSFWTLPTEWRWYFLFPIFIFLWGRIRGLGTLLVMIPISIWSMYVLEPSHFDKLQFIIAILPTYLPLFALGVWAAQLIGTRQNRPWEEWMVRHSPAGVALFALALVLFGPLSAQAFSTNATIRLLTWGPLSFFAVLAAATPGNIINRFGSLRPLVSVGIFSYSLYLVHEPFVRGAASVILAHNPSEAVQIAAQLIVPTVLIAVGYAFFLIAERPFLRKKAA